MSTHLMPVSRTDLQLALFGNPEVVVVGGPDPTPVAQPEPLEPDPAEQAWEAEIAESIDQMELFVAGYPPEQRRDVALGLYRDADGQLRTSHGALTAV